MFHRSLALKRQQCDLSHLLKISGGNNNEANLGIHECFFLIFLCENTNLTMYLITFNFEKLITIEKLIFGLPYACSTPLFNLT